MSHTYKLVELVGTSPNSFAEATRAAIEEASKTIRHMDWFEVVEQRGRIVDGKVHEFQVTLKIGFKIERWTAPGTLSWVGLVSRVHWKWLEEHDHAELPTHLIPGRFLGTELRYSAIRGMHGAPVSGARDHATCHGDTIRGLPGVAGARRSD
jgi:hypothetical protein